jgi:hypothetical protein
MPNHITNVLFITGDATLVKQLQDKIYRIEIVTEKTWRYNVGDKCFIIDFKGTVAQPIELGNTNSPAQSDEELLLQAELTKKYGAGNWYTWNIKFWGTKWNAYDTEELETIENGIQLRFNTAWSPPDSWLISSAKQYPTLKFKDYYINEGGGAGLIHLHIAEGIETVEQIKKHDWKMKFDKNYREEYLSIINDDYQKVIEKYQKQNEVTYSLEEFFLNRIKNEDLPLFIKFNWNDIEKFEQRLKNNP